MSEITRKHLLAVSTVTLGRRDFRWISMCGVLVMVEADTNVLAAVSQHTAGRSYCLPGYAPLMNKEFSHDKWIEVDADRLDDELKERLAASYLKLLTDRVS